MTVTLTGAKAARGGDAVSLTVELRGKAGGETQEFTLLAEDGAPYLSRVPCAVTQEELLQLEEANGHAAAVFAALRLLEYGDNSSFKMKQKLAARKISRSDAEYAVAYLRQRGLIDDAALLRAEILRAANEKLYGRRRIISDMFARGYTQRDIREQLLLCEAEIDYEENKKALLIRQYGSAELPRDYAEAQRVRAYLARRGY